MITSLKRFVVERSKFAVQLAAAEWTQAQACRSHGGDSSKTESPSL